LLGVSFSVYTDDVLRDLSRIFPFHDTPRSARPVDAFIRSIPNVYDFKVNDGWHQLTLYNDTGKQTKEIHVPLSLPPLQGGLSLDPSQAYYFYDFWNDVFLGKMPGNETLTQVLRPDEARMISVHRVSDHPQFISTDRHLMQGCVELSDVHWGKGRYSGTARVPADDSLRIIMAKNGYEPVSATVSTGICKIVKHADPDLAVLEISSAETADIEWSVEWTEES